MTDSHRMLKQAKIGLLLLNIPILATCVVVAVTQPSLRAAFIVVGALQVVGLYFIFRYINGAIARLNEQDKEP